MKNVGNIDAAIRVAAGIVILGVAAAFNARPFLAIAAALAGLLLIWTGLARFCPLYTFLGVSTATGARTA